jgi:hypothetical protein
MTLLSSNMRDVLIDHLDKEVPILRVAELRGFRGSAGGDRIRTVQALLARGLLKTNGIRGKRAGTHTLMTEAGRRELCALLGEYADAIMRARFELPPAGGGVPTAPAPHRRKAEAEALAAGAHFDVDISAAEAHLNGDYPTPAEGATDGDAVA